MAKTIPTRYFLGANTKRGFFSLYDGFTDPAAGDFLWVIKGGPGCGKSTFMKRIGTTAEDAGERVEYVHCSGDPDSLDAVWLPERRVGYVDGTFPHVQEAIYPGAASKYLDMGQFLDEQALIPHLPEIVDLNRRYKAMYGEAYDLLAAGAALLPKNVSGLWGAEETEKLDKRISGLAARELKRLGKTARIKRRFLSAVSCKGRITLAKSLEGMRTYLLDNTLGLGHEYLSRLAAESERRGYDLILCPDPLEPEKLEAVLLPEAELAFLAAEPSGVSPALSAYRHLRLDALITKEKLTEQRALLRQRRRDSEALLGSAVERLASAKKLHDALEDVYKDYVNFNGADLLVKKHLQLLFSR